MSSKLVEIVDHEAGCDLVLEDSRHVLLNIRESTIHDYVDRHGFPPLEEFIAARSISVFVGRVTMSPQLWSTVSAILREVTSPVSTVPELQLLLSLEHSKLTELPHRLYGGIGVAHGEVPPVFYTSVPVDFVTDNHRGGNWFRCLLSAPGFNVYETQVDVARRKVHVVVDNLPDHFLEDRRIT